MTPGRYTTGHGTIIRGFAAMTRGDVRFFRSAGIGMAAIGAVLVLGFGAMAWQGLSFEARAVVVEARVVGLTEWPQQRGPALVSAEFEFVLPDGRAAQATGASAPRPCCRPGEVVRLRVDPAHPGFVEPAEVPGAWSTSLAFVALGLAFMACGALGIGIARRGARARRAGAT